MEEIEDLKEFEASLHEGGPSVQKDSEAWGSVHVFMFFSFFFVFCWDLLDDKESNS